MSPWLSVIGIGEDGIGGLGPAARQSLNAATCLYGGARHLAMIPDDGRERIAWPSSMLDAFDGLLARRPENVAVLASGDPLWFGVGATLAKRVPADEMTVHPAPSALALACARMGWARADVDGVTLHGRDAATLEPNIQPGARLVVLSADGRTPAEIARRLTDRGFGPSRMTVLERMGGDGEYRRDAVAESFDLTGIDALNTVTVTCVPGPAAQVLPRTPGLPDAAFIHDGQMTKSEIRAVTLARLMPMPGAMLWDIGAGSGSIAIEWMRSAPRTRATAIEPRADRRTMIRQNAAALGVPGLRLIDGLAPDALDGLDPPDAVFIGGGLTGDASGDLIAAAMNALLPGGRLVANAVTLGSEAILASAHRDHGGSLTRLQIARAEPVGPHQGWRPLMPVTQWAWSRPWAEDDGDGTP